MGACFTSWTKKFGNWQGRCFSNLHLAAIHQFETMGTLLIRCKVKFQGLN